MRSNFYPTCLILFLFAFITTNASPMTLDANMAPRDILDTRGIISRENHPGLGGGEGGVIGGDDPYISRFTPACDVHTGFGSIDGVLRTNTLQVIDQSINKASLHFWQGTLSNGGKRAILSIKINSDRNIEIKASSNDGFLLPGKFEVETHPDVHAGNQETVKYYLNTNKGDTCHIFTGHTPGYYSSVSVRY